MITDDANRQRLCVRRLTELMERRGFTAASLAERAGVKRNMVRSILRGRSRNPGIFTLTKIADALGVPATALVLPFMRGDAK